MANETELPAAAPAAADSRSIEDRIADKFLGSEPGDAPEVEATPEADSAPDAEAPEAEATEEAPAEAATAETEEIEYEGSKYVVPKELKDAFMAKSDYTRKTQEVANKAREVEAMQAQIQVAQAERAFIESITSETQTIALIDARRKELFDNWASLTADQKQDVRYLDEQRDQIVKSIEGKRGEFLKGQETAINELRTKALDAVSKVIPGWSEKVKQEISDHAKTDGYTEQELANIIDPRHAKTLWKAMQFDKLQAKARSVVKASPVAKAAPTKTMPPETRSALNFRKAIHTHKPGSAEYKAALQERIAQKFGG